MSGDSIPGAIAFGIGVGIVFVLFISLTAGTLLLAGEGLSFVLERPLLKGVGIGSFGSMLLITLIAAALYETGKEGALE